MIFSDLFFFILLKASSAPSPTSASSLTCSCAAATVSPRDFPCNPFKYFNKILKSPFSTWRRRVTSLNMLTSACIGKLPRASRHSWGRCNRVLGCNRKQLCRARSQNKYIQALFRVQKKKNTRFFSPYRCWVEHILQQPRLPYLLKLPGGAVVIFGCPFAEVKDAHICWFWRCLTRCFCFDPCFFCCLFLLPPFLWGSHGCTLVGLLAPRPPVRHLGDRFRFTGAQDCYFCSRRFSVLRKHQKSVCVVGGGRVRKKRKKYAHSHVQNSALWSTNTAVRFTCSRGRLLGLRSAAAGTSASKPRSIRFGGLWFTIVCNFLPRVIPRFSYENWRQRRWAQWGLVSSSVLCRVLAELYFDSYNFTGRVGVCWEAHLGIVFTSSSLSKSNSKWAQVVDLILQNFFSYNYGFADSDVIKTRVFL